MVIDEKTVAAFNDELEKIAGWGFLGRLWSKFTSLFRPESRDQKRVDYHFSPKAGPEKWNKFAKNVRRKGFVDKVVEHPNADSKLIQHAKSMHDMSRGKTVGKIYSSRLPGRSYEIRSTPSGLACTCPDWRFKSSVSPGRPCKHIKAHLAGKTKAD